MVVDKIDGSIVPVVELSAPLDVAAELVEESNVLDAAAGIELVADDDVT